MKHLSVIFIGLAAILFLTSSCDFLSPESSSTGSDKSAFEAAFMQSFDLLHSKGVIAGDERSLTPSPRSSASGSKATVNVSLDGYTFSFADTDKSLADYPEQGQTTVYSVFNQGGEVYKITATTSYPAAAVQSYTIESYYVLDVSPGSSVPDGEWTIDDPVVDPDGNLDPLYRETFETWFKDGSVRYETIVAVRAWDGSENSYAEFDFAGSLDYPDFFMPVEDSQAVYSSVVVYTHIRNTDHNFSFWEGSEVQNILGIRYYTETLETPGITAGVEETVNKTTLAFEKAISAYVTAGGDYISRLGDIYLGSEHQVLAESVIRQYETYTATDGDGDGDFDTTTASIDGPQTVMKSHVVDITGSADFYLTRLNDNATELGNWEGSSLYMPEGDAAEIAAADADSQIERTTTTTNSEGLTVDLVTEDIGSSDIAQLYRSISTGAASIPSTSVPKGMDADGDGLVEQYDGDQGRVEDSAIGGTDINLSTRGTISVWVYIDKYQDFGGIVHKGVQPDFTDESYSLQFWGDRGQVAFIVNQNPANGYEILYSSFRLNRKKWYHLAATWDSVTADTDGKYYMRLYINGQFNRREEISAGYTAHQNSSPVVIGSQLAGEDVLSGYYGFDGFMDGLALYGTALDAEAVQSLYLTQQP
ncbi:MAG: LamG domain-containing protein [Spirochaetales bacterium]|nr:LamG domain-containing protein [Spirochaetales bacterium]